MEIFYLFSRGKAEYESNACWDVGADVVFHKHKHGKQRYNKSLLGNYIVVECKDRRKHRENEICIIETLMPSSKNPSRICIWLTYAHGYLWSSMIATFKDWQRVKLLQQWVWPSIFMLEMSILSFGDW